MSSLLEEDREDVNLVSYCIYCILAIVVFLFDGPFPLLRHTSESTRCILIVVVKPASICLCSLLQWHDILLLLFIILRRVSTRSQKARQKWKSTSLVTCLQQYIFINRFPGQAIAMKILQD